MIQLQGAKAEDVVARVVADQEAWSRARQDKEYVWKECLRAFLSQHPSTRIVTDGRSNRYIPLAHQGCMNIHSQLLTSLLPHPDFFQVVGETADDEEFADQVSLELSYLLDKMGFYTSASSIILQAIIFGTAPYSLTWETTWTRKTERLVGIIPIREWKKAYYGPRLVPLDLFNVWWDPTSNEHPTRVPVCMKSWRQKSVLKQMAKPGPSGYVAYSNIGQIQDKPSNTRLEDQSRTERAALQQISDDTVTAERHKGEAELIERWGDFPIEIDGEVRVLHNYLAVVANEGTLIRFEPNPISSGRIPINQVQYQKSPKPTDMYGIGAIEPALDVGDLANTVFNQFVDLVAKMVKGQHKYLATDPFFDPENWEMAVDQLIPVGVMDNLQPILNDIRLLNIVEVFGLLKAEHQDAMGSVKNYTQANYEKTATEVAHVAGIAAARYKELVRHFESTFIEQVLEQMVALRADFARDDGEVERRQVGSDNKVSWEAVDPQAFERNFRIRGTGSGYIAQRELRIQQYILLLQTLGTIDPAMLQAHGIAVNIPEIIRLIYREFGHKNDSTIFMRTEAPNGGRDTGEQPGGAASAGGNGAGAAAGAAGLAGVPGAPQV